MNPLQEVQGQISSYLDGALSLDELEDWLAESAESLSQAGDDAAVRLSARAWRLISELGYGHRDENSVREELRKAMPQRVRMTHAESVGGVTVAHSSRSHLQVHLNSSPRPFGPSTIPVLRYPEPA